MKKFLNSFSLLVGLHVSLYLFGDKEYMKEEPMAYFIALLFIGIVYYVLSCLKEKRSERR